MAVAVLASAVTVGGTTVANAAGDRVRVESATAWTGAGENLSTAPQVLKVAGVDASHYTEKLNRAAEREAQRVVEAIAAQEAAQRAEAERIAREAAEQAAREEAARRPALAFPAAGTLTSGYGPRWGTNHNGIDVANSIGTPIVSVTDGVVIESGPASGFGLWVRIAQDDGTTGVYGHIDQSLVSVGQHVRAGEQIATMGNRGQSTGPHLHYEVWQPGGAKVDPIPWFHARGVPVPSSHLG
ncbi:M23 family metallopeptidase [Rhodococcus pyridinivorans]|uniref:M23 family metallopeptidase n=1 Tax=Rhodococcus pyridinivorans TaxID=103816 RepID=UPI00200A65F4|nr:M23 family metallopeptidase [Rhodococcus pyridinivorans]UPW06677.1 M23 family metallopeptidase [Rhodococcus pyridinivorans]